MSALDDRPDLPVLRSALRSLDLRAAATALSTLSFWAAIVLPVIYLPLLAAGIETTEGLVLFLGLFGLHVLALLVGRTHASPAGT